MASTTYWDTQNHRPLSESAAQTLMLSFAHELLRAASASDKRVSSADLSRVLQRRSGIEVRVPAGGETEGAWLVNLLNRVDQRAAQAGEGPALSSVVAWGRPASPPPPRPAGRGSGAARSVPAAPARHRSTEPLQGSVCPRCFMQMSLTGVCDNCA
ncbi:hypothetical protein [Aestuariimicrobium ganziense]|uniref:hypothetical protein n=1 Tax=Aestuariimicrobium ganziense TaxID=2773677 RepID=UPI00194179DB|nr:hypothetical protein [Aestuariimicrobium ganziense]